VGHAWSPESLLAQQADALDSALWTALRVLEEKSALTRRLVQRARLRGHTFLANRFDASVAEVERQAAVIRDALAHSPLASGDGQPDNRTTSPLDSVAGRTRVFASHPREDELIT
jgi:two-component system chemotaxis response regulator CheB